MTTSVVLAATTAADTSVTGSVAAETVRVFGTSALGNNERIVFEQANSTGGYHAMWYLANDGKRRQVALSSRMTTVRLVGPVDFRINKPITARAVEIVEYT